MNPAVESALIAATATLVAVGGTVIVAIAASRNSRRTNQATIDGFHADAQLTLDAAREAQFADRYSRALEQVGSGNLDVRIGGIYALEGIALDSPRYHPTVMEVLTAFIREHSSTSPGSPKPARWPLPDVLTALTVVGRRKKAHDIRPMDLAYADLADASLSHANLTDAELTGANLTRVYLSYADLTGARLYNADLTGARLYSADLIGARLSRAKLSHADLSGANLSGADLTYADLTGARLYSADLTGADLTAADLTEADFTEAKLDMAKLDTAKAVETRWPGGLPIPKGWALDSSECLAAL